MRQTLLRIGVVGAGGVATRHVDTLGAFADVEIAAVADVAGDRAAALAERCGGARVFTRADELLAKTEVDALYICVPPFAHGPPERAALQAGLPFFVEKPLSLDLAAAEAIAGEVADRGLITATGYHWRNLDTLDAARDALAGRPVRLAIASWLDKVPPVAWWTRRDGSGGQTIEQSTHLLDVLLELVGEVEEVAAIGSRTDRAAFPDADIDDAFAATLRFASGAVGSLASTSLLHAKHRAVVELFAEGVALSLTEDKLTVDSGDGPAVLPASGEAKMQVDRDFIDAVAGGPNRVRAPYGTALRTHRVALALARSADEGRALRV